MTVHQALTPEFFYDVHDPQDQYKTVHGAILQQQALVQDGSSAFPLQHDLDLFPRLHLLHVFKRMQQQQQQQLRQQELVRRSSSLQQPNHSSQETSPSSYLHRRLPDRHPLMMGTDATQIEIEEILKSDDPEEGSPENGTKQPQLPGHKSSAMTTMNTSLGSMTSSVTLMGTAGSTTVTAPNQGGASPPTRVKILKMTLIQLHREIVRRMILSQALLHERRLDKAQENARDRINKEQMEKDRESNRKRRKKREQDRERRRLHKEILIQQQQQPSQSHHHQQ